ncbi:hypothetical protein IGI37_000257 [Enterococcus sp. AZ194]|uniref:thiocillin family RiPP n=1 Tax=Enterococcus sp. AZ194 TaxID=2774629 RepID=UPI003F1FFDA3
MNVKGNDKETMEELTITLDNIFLEEETDVLEVAASFGTLSTLGTATGCASTLGTVSCFG